MPSLCLGCKEPLAFVTNAGGSWASTQTMSLDCPVSPDGLHHPDLPEEESDVTEQQFTAQPAQPGDDGPAGIETLVQNAVQNALGSLMGSTGPASFEDALAEVDPRDSDTALLMLDWLSKTGRVNRVGILDGGQGYLFVYAEPKGADKAGYRPGATQGDRIVDSAVDQQRAAGIRAAKRSMCVSCLTAVRQEEGGPVVSDDDAANAACPAGGNHVMA